MRPATILGMLVLAAAAASQDAPGPPQGQFRGDVLQGRQVFVGKGCVRCHAVLGSGGTAGPDLGESAKGSSFLDLLGRLWSHSPQMVEAVRDAGLEWPRLNATEMDDLLSYLYYLNYFDKPGNFERGEQVYRGKGCVSCHSVGGLGGEVAPHLDAYGAMSSPVSIVAAMWNHGPNMSLKMHELSVPKPEFKGTDVADLLAYIRGVTVTADVRRGEYVKPGNPQRGQQLFKEAGCGRCHVVGGRTDGLSAGTIGPDLARADLQHSVSELAGVMWNHGPIMWEQMKLLDLPVITLNAADMADIIAYLYFINYSQESGDPVAGQAVALDKGCSICHQVGTAGEFEGPSFITSKAIESPTAFAAALWNHAPAMVKKVESRILAWPEFRDHEMRDLHAFLVSLKTRKD